MAGPYGEINSRAGYHRVVGDAMDIARRVVERGPNYDGGIAARPCRLRWPKIIYASKSAPLFLFLTVVHVAV
jgi:hypothetical protein